MANAVLTSGGLAFFRDFAIGLNPTPPMWIAVSSGTLPSPPAPGRFWWQLPAETFRTAIVGADAAGTAAIFHAFLGLTDNQNQVVCYYGLYGGSGANGAANSGTLIAVAAEPSPYGKNASSTVNLDLVLTMSGTVN
jgi:hypothetical protein